MKRLAVSVETLLERGVDADVTYVVVDTYKFSTTVTVALSEGIDRVYCEPTTAALEPYRHDDAVLAGGEPAAGMDDPIGNSPALVRQCETAVDTIALTSENGAKRTHQLVDAGAESLLLGCFRNAEAVATLLDQTDEWVLVPADSAGTPQFEDYLAAVLIRNLTAGVELTDRVRSSYQQRVAAATQFEATTGRRRRDWQTCTAVGTSTVVPEWNAAGYFA